jgi:multidrug resistance efflux pump
VSGAGRAAAPERSAAFERESELLPRDPPPAIARALASFAIALAAAGGLAAVLVRVPETVRCPFTLVPIRGTDPLKAPRRGTVERVGATEGADVRAGDVLFVLRSEELTTLAAERDALVREVAGTREKLHEAEAEAAAALAGDAAAAEEASARVARLEREAEAEGALDDALAAKHASSLAGAQARGSSLEGEVALEGERESLARDIRDRTEAAAQHGAVSNDEAVRERRAYADAALSLAHAKGALAAAQAALADLRAGREREVRERALGAVKREGELAEARAAAARTGGERAARAAQDRERAADLRAALEKAEVRLASLARELEGADGDLLRIAAPFDGAIVRLGPRRPGVVIERGDVLCELAARGAELRAELLVPESAAGEIAPGEAVKLLFAAYPYPRYGTRAATLSWVSPAGSGAAFRGLATLDERAVVVAGERRDLRAGMGGEAHVVTGRRTIAEYVLEPLRALRENAKER